MQIKLGDSLFVLRTLPENSIDSVVTDPPYGLAFMNKHWDYDVPSVELWREVLRVLKPGGHVLSFGGTRTYHRMVVNIEDAGFEIRDQIMWIYGSGFPKSHDVSKAIDKEAGAEREVVETKSAGSGPLKRGHVTSTGGGMSIGTERSPEYNVTAPATDLAKQWQGWGTALKPANEPIVLARKPLVGTVAANVEQYGTGGLNIDASRIGSEVRTNIPASSLGNARTKAGGAAQVGRSPTIALGRWPANVLFDEEAAAVLDEQSGIVGKGNNRGGYSYAGREYDNKNSSMFNGDKPQALPNYNDSGSASRFFYVAKASKRERGEGNNHPTVKPIKLMEYLVRMITPPGGTVLDPFMGSGTTGVAVKSLGFKFFGIELEKTYHEIATRRIEAAAQ